MRPSFNIKQNRKELFLSPTRREAGLNEPLEQLRLFYGLVIVMKVFLDAQDKISGKIAENF